jgi:hypothetical protein
MSDVRKAETEKCVVDTAAWTRASGQALLTVPTRRVLHETAGESAA